VSAAGASEGADQRALVAPIEPPDVARSSHLGQLIGDTEQVRPPRFVDQIACASELFVDMTC
jgi:hypothetical protein